MEKQDPGSARQLRSLLTAALLSPGTRLIPGAAAALGGKTAWLGPMAALPGLLLYALLLEKLGAGEALPERALRLLGRRARPPLLLLGLWFACYSAFALRSGAERLQVTAYPHSGPGFFVICLALLALFAALGPLQGLFRLGRMTLPLLLGVLGLILWAALRDLEPQELLPLTHQDAPTLLRSTLPSLDLVSFALSARCLFPADREGGSLRRSALWTAGLCLGLTALGAAVQGRFGAALSARLSSPFFALVRNLVFFQSLERMEAPVVGLWILPDFLLASLCLQAAQRCLRTALGHPPVEEKRRTDLKNGRLLIWLCAALTVTLALLPSLDPASLLFWSRTGVPLLQLTVSFLLIPGIALACRRKEKKNTESGMRNAELE